MALRILVTGTSGYIGGTFLNNLLKSPEKVVPNGNIYALVRTPAQVSIVEALGIKAVLGSLDAAGAAGVFQSITNNEIDVVIHTADAIMWDSAKPLLEGLAARSKSSTGKAVHFIHTSGCSAFSDNTGYTHGFTKDTDDVYELQKETENRQTFLVRALDIKVHDYGKAHGIKTYIVSPPMIYGKGTGFGNKISQHLVAIIRAGLAKGEVNHFWNASARFPAVHILDLADLYVVLLRAIASGKDVPSGAESGYYFAVSHDIAWREAATALAKDMYEKKLVRTPETHEWSSEEEAAKHLGFLPPGFVNIAWNSSVHLDAQRGPALGWKPRFDREYLLANWGLEVEAVVEADGVAA